VKTHLGDDRTHGIDIFLASVSVHNDEHMPRTLTTNRPR
jgi:hypothetical protein